MSGRAPIDTGVSSSRALLAFAAGCLFFGYAFVQRVAPSVMTGELMRDFGVGGAALGTLSAWYFYAYAGIQLPVGLLTDRFGPRRLLSAAMALCAVGSFGFAFSDSLLGASVFRAVIGATVAFGFVGTLTIAGYWFSPRRFAMLAGIVQAVGMTGAMLGQAPLRFAVEQFGWRSTMGVIGAVAILLAIGLFFIIPRRPAQRADSGPRPGPLAGLHGVVSNPQSWACAGIGFGMTAIMLAFAGLWAVPWLTSVHGFSATAAAGIASLLFLGWAIGAPLAGWLSDHMGRRKPVLYVGALGNLILFAVIVFGGIESAGTLSLLFFLLGISGSGMTTVFGVMREVNSTRHGATAMGLVNMCVVGSGAVMQPVVGILLDLGWDGQLVAGARLYSAETYSSAFTVLVASNVLALACIAVMRETHCRQLEGTD